MKNSELNMANVINLLIDNCFIEDGKTKETTVRIPTVDSPLFGKSGGILVTFGGRLRFNKENTTIKATVGKRTTYIYYLENSTPKTLISVDTKEFEKIKEVICSL